MCFCRLKRKSVDLSKIGRGGNTGINIKIFCLNQSVKSDQTMYRRVVNSQPVGLYI